jgi:hypothetical protein
MWRGLRVTNKTWKLRLRSIGWLTAVAITATATTTTTPVVAALGNKKSTAESSAAAKLDVCFATMGSSVL